MKQLVFMVVLTLWGTVGTFLISPLCGVVVYYLFAILRPNFLWEWSLPPGITWSYYVAIACILAMLFEVIKADPGEAASRPGRVRHGLWSTTHTFIAVFVAWLEVSYVEAIDQTVAYPWLIDNLKILVMFITSAMLLKRTGDVWKLYLAAVASVGYVAYEANAQYLMYRINTIQLNGFGGYDNNGAGLMFAMGVPLCLFAFEGASRWWRWGFPLLIPVLVHAVLLTFSRGAMTSLLCATPLILLRSRYRGIVIPVAIVLMATALPVMAGPEVRKRFFSVSDYGSDASANARFASWTAALRIANDHPIFGAGIRNSNLLSFQYGADGVGRTIHNQFLQIAADTGYPGLFLYLCVLGSAWRATRRVRIASARLDDPRARQSRAIACGVETSIAVFCIGALFLSLETFELAYLLILMGAQLTVVSDSVVHDPAAGDLLRV